MKDDRDVLIQVWSRMYDMSEQLVSGPESPPSLAPLIEQQRLQINVRRIQLPWLGTHVLYVEEFSSDRPFEPRRRVMLKIEAERTADGELHIRQYTRKGSAANAVALSPGDVESVAGCDLFLKHEGAQFRGGTRGRGCLDSVAGEPHWLDYRLVIGDGLFWYRQRKLLVADNELIEEVAGFPHADFDAAQLFSCGISWAPPKSRVKRRPLESVDLHDRGGRVRFRTPDGRELRLELHGRDWPLSEGRESLVLTLTDPLTDETVGSSWTSLGAARVGLDLKWLAIDCAPMVSETGEQRS